MGLRAHNEAAAAKRGELDRRRERGWGGATTHRRRGQSTPAMSRARHGKPRFGGVFCGLAEAANADRHLTSGFSGLGQRSRK